MEESIGIGWVALSIVIGVMASNRGRTGFGWFLLSCILSPIIAGIFLLLAGRKEVEIPQRKCPMCAEMVLIEAIKCKHCGADLPKETDPPPVAAASPTSKGGGAVFVGILLCLGSLFAMIGDGFGMIAAVVFLVGVGLVLYNVRRNRNKQSTIGN